MSNKRVFCVADRVNPMPRKQGTTRRRGEKGEARRFCLSAVSAQLNSKKGLGEALSPRSAPPFLFAPPREIGFRAPCARARRGERGR